MRLGLYLIIVSAFTLLGACSTSQKIKQNISEGNYDTALDLTYNQLKENKNNDELVQSYKETFDKANARDLARIQSLQKEQSPERLKKIYALYEKLDARQYQVRALQPLYYKGKEVAFDLVDYADKIKTSKKTYADYLYQQAQQKLAAGGKQNARKAYQLLGDLQFASPDYTSDLQTLISTAKARGSSLVLLKANNGIASHTSVEDIEELTRVSGAAMNNPWVIFDREKDPVKSYDYQVTINLNEVQMTPGEVNTEVVPQQKRIADGWEYVYDSNGNVMKDENGNDVKQQKIITVQAEVRLFQQVKQGIVKGDISVRNLKNNMLSTPVTVQGEAKYENVYGQYRGDQRAIDQKYYKALQNKEQPFPADSLFVQYGLKDFKSKLLQFIDQQEFDN